MLRFYFKFLRKTDHTPLPPHHNLDQALLVPFANPTVIGDIWGSDYPLSAGETLGRPQALSWALYHPSSCLATIPTSVSSSILSAYNTPVTHPSLAGSLSEVACDASLIQFLI